MKQKFIALAKKLGLTSKINDGKMTGEDWEKFAAAFKKEYDVDILAAIKEAGKTQGLEKKHQEAIAALFAGVTSKDDGTAAASGDDGAGAAEASRDDGASAAAASGDDGAGAAAASGDDQSGNAAGQDINVAAEIKKLKGQVAQLSQEPEQAAGKKGEAKPGKLINIRGKGHNKTHAFGIEVDFFSRSKPWNEVTATGAALVKKWSRSEVDAFKEEFDQYAESFANRINTLQKQGLLGIMKQDNYAASIDYSGFDNSGWGNEYVVRRQDAIIAYLRKLPSVSSIFPVHYGVQNKMVMTNAFFTEFSQAYQPGKTVMKGAYNLEPDEATVDDVMFKNNFSNLKTLEKEYVGYLNREGSDPMKWTLIEWLMVETLVVLHNEQEQRRVRGYRIEPVTDVAGHYMFGADGVIRRLRSFEEDFKIQVFDQQTYSSSTILDYVKTMVESANQIIPSLRGYYLYMNEKHVPWYKSKYRETYGTDLDFKGSVLQVMDYAIDGIVPVPNMGNLCVMWITKPGNVELYEDLAGEMEKLYFQRDLEELLVASWWKEGVGAYISGRKYTSAALLAASNRKYQYIFINDAYTQLAADATTADASVNDTFKTQANSGATAFTDFTNSEEGIVCRIELGSVTNATAIAKSGKFSEISATWTPTAVGDFLEVYWVASTSKFKEVRRQVT